MKKKVAIVGNMNNFMFPLMRWLRDEDYDAHLFYHPYEEHFKPTADTFSLDPLKYCHEVDWLIQGLNPYNFDVLKIQKEIAGFDYIIGEGLEAAALFYCGIQLDIYFPFGIDVYQWAGMPHEHSFTKKIIYSLMPTRNSKTLKKGTIHKYVYGAIKNARYVFMDLTNNDFKDKLDSIEINGIYKPYPVPFLYLKEYENYFSLNIHASVHWRDIIDKLRDENDLLILYHGRQEWKTYVNEFTGKNTNYLIEGFASFIQEKQLAYNAKLIMIEYGTDVNASKELIKKLNIDDYVIWFPKMLRKDILYLITKIDIGSGEFGRSYISFGTIMENMLMGKPVIHFREDNLYLNKYRSLYPLLNAKFPNEIKDQLLKYYLNKNELIRIGSEARDWSKKNLILNPLDEIIKVLKN